MPVNNLSITEGSEVPSVNIDVAYLSELETELNLNFNAANREVDAMFGELKSQLDLTSNEMKAELNEFKLIGDSAYNKIQGDFNRVITGIRNGQQMQVLRSAMQLDSVIASGQFGGNVYRAQQTYSMNISNAIASANELAAKLTLDFTVVAEQFRLQARSTYLDNMAKINDIILSAQTQLVTSHATIKADLSARFSDGLIKLGQLHTQIATTEAKLEADLAMAERQNQINLITTAWNNNTQRYVADVNAAASNYRVDVQAELGYAEIAAQINISAADNITQIKVAEISAGVGLYTPDPMLPTTLPSGPMDMYEWRDGAYLPSATITEQIEPYTGGGTAWVDGVEFDMSKLNSFDITELFQQ